MNIYKLNSLMQSMPTKFTFIRCLHPDDAEIFKTKYVKYYNYYSNPAMITALESGGIPLQKWIYLLNYCSPLLHNRYSVYRQCYKGESDGDPWMTKNMDMEKYWAKVREYGHPDRRPIKLLLSGNTIQQTKICRESYYVNNAILFWNLEDDEVIY